MTINIQKYTQALVQKISSSTCANDLNLLSAAVKQLRAGQVYNVPTVLCLMLIPTSSADAGKLFYVEEDETLYFKNNQNMWIDLSGPTTQTKVLLWGCGTTSSYSGVDQTPSTGFMADLRTGGTTWCLLDSGRWSNGGSNIAGIKTDGTLWTWGTNHCGQLGNGYAGALTGRGFPGTTVGGGTNWCHVSVNTFSGCFMAGIKTNGTLWTWGGNDFGQLGDGTGGFGTGKQSPVVTAGAGTNWKTVAAGDEFAAAVKTDGTLWTWGRASYCSLANGWGNCNISRSSPATISSGGTTWTCVKAAGRAPMALKTDGTLWRWGQGICIDPQQVGSGTDWCFISEDGGGTAIKNNGTLWEMGVSETEVPGGGTNWCFTSLGYNNKRGIKTDGTLWTWGTNCGGNLGDGTNVSRNSPGTTVCPANNWWKVSGGFPNIGLQRI